MISGLNRGALPKVIEKELNNYQIKYVGSHKGTLPSIIFDANIKKFFNLLFICIFSKIDLGVSVGSFLLGSALKLLGKYNIQFDDDPESFKNAFLEKLTCTELFYPPLIKPYGKIKTMNALKEWAYLSPKYLTPNKQELNKYNLTPKQYIFIREVSTGSLYYRDQSPNIIAEIANKLPSDYIVLLSLEDKTTIKKYPSDWILLEEPIEDIHSLIYYSKIVISSGDSMAREGAMLGVPSIYCGIRNMRANTIMIDKGMLVKANPNKAAKLVKSIIIGEIKFENQVIFREKLIHEWDDITEFIIKQIMKYKN